MGQVDFPIESTLEGAVVNELIWMIYGPPGIGKSTFFSNVEGVYFLHTDPGLKFIDTRKTFMGTWPKFKDYVRELQRKPPKWCRMIVIDTVDLLYRMCRKSVCTARNIEHVADEEWGKGHDMVRDEFEQQIVKLCSLGEQGIGIAFISHDQQRETRGRVLKTSKTVPTLPGGAHKVIAPLCDIIGWAGYALEKADGKGEQRRLIHFEPDETLEAKDRTKLLPKKCALDFKEVSSYLSGLKKKDGGVKKKAVKKMRKRRRA